MSGEPLETTEETPAQPVQQTQLEQMPLLGLLGIAQQLYPGDIQDKDKMLSHVADLFALNSDRLRNDVSFIVGQMVKIPVIENGK